MRTLTSRAVLTSRAAVLVKGVDARDFLQGLATNDMSHLDGMDAIYTMFLNVQGRVLFDALVLKAGEQGDVLVDCHKDQAESLIKHLKMYKLRKKVDIARLEGASAVATQEEDMPAGDCLASGVDPRAPGLGRRTWLTSPSSSSQLDDESAYDDVRYWLGVAEGPSEIPSGKCFPLEYNADYMHGVSFHKGCYVGQELTARTHHTGVVRKRVMPLVLDESPSEELQLDSNVLLAEGGKRVGKLRGLMGLRALALLRIDDVLANEGRVKVGDVWASTSRPEWWPAESPKRSQRLRTSEE